MLIITNRWANAQDIPAKLDSLFNYQYTSRQLIGNVLVAEDGKVLYQKSFGYADIPNKIPNNDQSIFEIGSISKTLTSTAILQLVQKKKIGLNDPYKKYFPGFPYPDITIRNLLSHTSGLPRDRSDVFDTLRKIQPERMFDYHDILPALEKYHRPLIFKPGDKWAYSNIGYNLLAVLIEKVTNLPFNVYMKKNIFIPAGMADTYVKTLSDPKNSHLVKGYFHDKHYLNELKEADPNWEKGYTLFVGEGYVFSTTPDMLKFDEALYNNKLVSAALLAEAYKPTILNNGQKAIAEGGGASKLSYGLGWFILNDTTAGRIVLHSGYNPGVWTIFFRNISKKQSVIILSNGEMGRNFERGLNAMNLLNHKHLVANKLSMAGVYINTLYEQGPDAAIIRLIQMRSDTANFFYAEGQMNYLANELLDNGFTDKGLEASKITVLMTPTAAWLYKAYGDLLLKADKKQDAVKMYKKTLALKPDDKGAKEALMKLGEKEH
ncbi:serine hydrolase [Mucilaginibacter sp. BJC16-A38]|uniref:serine hydrolase n=1 Tax=Mucilaginibacter phenanthrenivorans TaxID=1234842 RepID=UPI002157DAC7|nr:serine hydrolase [Mucilaginibacter phenanthrenivorans]MCR8561416.1 serine hydrolase [Mucilaginibacter phenanthrenivorans]